MTNKAKINLVLLVISVWAIVLIILAQPRIVDNRDYPDDGYDVYFHGEKKGYLYLHDGIDYESIN